MNRRVAAIVAVVAVLVASLTIAVAVTVAHDDGNGFGRRDGMMPGLMHGLKVSSEYDYLAEMVVHHEEAVAAAQELQRSERAAMRQFGQRIVSSQSAQIDLMQHWLAHWYPDRSERVEYQPMMRDLTNLSGDRLDRAFLQDMTRHHMGAVMMSQRLLMLGMAEHRRVETLAATIRDEQHAEILQMQRWLHDWFGQAWRRGDGFGGMHGARVGPGST